MVETFDATPHFDSRMIPGWRKVSKGLLLMLIASPFAHAVILAFFLGLILKVPLILLRSTAAVIGLGGFLFLYGLYLCTEGPRKGSIPSIALAALLTGFAALALSVAQLALYLSSLRPGVPLDLEGLFLLLGVAAIGTLVVSHLVCVWLTSAVRRYCQPASSRWGTIVYVAVLLIFVVALGLAVLVSALLAFTPHRQQQGLSWRMYFNDEAKSLAFFALSVCSVLFNAGFVFLLVRARSAVSKMLASAAATPVTDSLSSPSPSPP